MPENQRNGNGIIAIFSDYGTFTIRRVQGPEQESEGGMTVSRPQSAATALLTQAADLARPHLDRSNPVGERLRALWAAVVAARDFGASDVVEEEFLQLARETGLFADLGSRANAELLHVIRWAIRDLNPFH
jgi:hypothetical protein